MPGKPPAHVDLRALAWGDTRYPFWLTIPQFETERCIAGHPCVRVGADGWQDPGGARLVIVRPDRIVAAAAATLDPRLIDHYARERLGVAPTDL